MTGTSSKKSPCDQEEVTVTSAQPVRGLGPSRLHVAGCRIMSRCGWRTPAWCPWARGWGGIELETGSRMRELGAQKVNSSLQWGEGAEAT